MKSLTITSGIKDYLISYENGVVTVKVRHCSGTVQNVRKQETIDRMMSIMNEEAIYSGKLRDEANSMNEEIDAIVEFSADRAPVQMDGDMNWVFEAAVAVWNARQVKEPSAQDQAITQTLARQNSLSHKIGLAFAGAALVFSSLAAPVQAEVVPSYPVDASRMSLEGSVAVSIDCSTLTVDVIRESNNAGYFSKQVKKQVANICYGEKGTLDRVYVFKMNKRVGAHDMMVNNTGRWTL
jgi:hypothetical protein|nr:MAG TPA: hypothetical protein [Caudoviricetes sp.]